LNLSASDARRLALAALGFDRPRPAKPTVRHLREVISRLGLLQIDYVNVLVPAQYQVPFSRLGAYDRAALDDLVYRRREYAEQWAHEACIVPMETWGLLHHRGHRRRWAWIDRFMRKHGPYADAVVERLRRGGPAVAADIPEPDGSKGKRPPGGFWSWTQAKLALEALFGAGVVGIADRRPDFTRVYDVVERVVPDEHRRPLDSDEARRELIRRAARALGVSTMAELADYHRAPVRDTAAAVAELVDAGELMPARVEGWREQTYVPRGISVPSARPEAGALISPFDPLVWNRKRTERLFGFDYRLEIWVPRAQRKYGYYVLPFLFGDRLAARVDLKADRAGRRLLVEGAWLERKANGAAVAAALAAELRTFADWLGLPERIAVGRRGNLARLLAAEGMLA
jgi:uncharacterized protein